eukprot:6180406-Pleurochrysis_carterae.AAC.2
MVVATFKAQRYGYNALKFAMLSPHFLRLQWVCSGLSYDVRLAVHSTRPYYSSISPMYLVGIFGSYTGSQSASRSAANRDGRQRGGQRRGGPDRLLLERA